jgi:hypothetical protein
MQKTILRNMGGDTSWQCFTDYLQAFTELRDMKKIRTHTHLHKIKYTENAESEKQRPLDGSVSYSLSVMWTRWEMVNTSDAAGQCENHRDIKFHPQISCINDMISSSCLVRRRWCHGSHGDTGPFPSFPVALNSELIPWLATDSVATR